MSWSDPQNWSGDALPAGNQDILIPAGAAVHLDVDFSMAASSSQLKVAAGATLTVDSGRTLWIDGMIDNTGAITVLGTMKGVPQNHTGGTIENSGSLVVEFSGGANFFNDGTVRNSGTVTNREAITNRGAWENTGTIANEGSFVVPCGGTFTGAGPVTGSALVFACALWDGGGDGVSWSDPLNWSPDVLPAGDKEIWIPSGASAHLDVPFTLTARPGVLRVKPGGTLTVDPGVTLTVDGFGTSIFVDGTLVNDGVLVTARSGTDIEIEKPAGSSTTALLWNRAGGVIENRGAVEVLYGGILKNEGTVENYGLLMNNLNGGPIQNFGLLHNESTGRLVNYTGATLENDGTIQNDGRFSNGSLGYCGGTLVNRGTITGNPIVEICKRWDGGGDGSNWSNPLNWSLDVVPTGDSEEQITIPASASVVLDVDFAGKSYLTIKGTATLTVATGRHLSLDGIIDVYGVLANYGDVTGVPENEVGGRIDNFNQLTVEFVSGGANFFNKGILNNTAMLVNRETITNDALGLIHNDGTIDNESKIQNNGRLEAGCNAVLSGAGTFTGNPVVDVCDTTPPVVQVPADVIAEATSPAGANVSFSASATDDRDGAVAVRCVPASGSVFALGTTAVTCSASDAAGNSASASFQITVRDTTPPSLAAPPDVQVPNDRGLATAFVADATLGKPVASDLVGVVSLQRTGIPAGNVFPLGVTVVIAYVALDAAGNRTTASQKVTVVDTEPPVVTAPPDVVVEAVGPAGATVSDAALGTATATDNAPGVTLERLGVPAGNLFPLGATTITYRATDGAGNVATAAQRVTVRDTTPPEIVIAAPAAKAYALGEVVAASYACADRVSGVATCSGPVPSGAPVPTGTVGTFTFTVTAVDGAGNASSASITYSVAYRACPLYDASRPAKSGSTLPVKLQLCDFTGANASSSVIVVTGIGVVRVGDATSTAVDDAGNANPDSNFRFDPTLGGTGGYIFNLSTKGLAMGTYALVWTATGDPSVHETDLGFQIR